MGYSIFDDTIVDMPWTEVEAAAKRGAIVLLPVGIIEEHGPHMGLGVDTYSAYLVAVEARKALIERGFEILISPPQYWGVSAATATFGGTFHVRPETMKNLIVDIIGNLKNWGFTKVFTVNWHADMQHVKTILAAVGEARKAYDIDVRFVVTEFELHRLRLTGDEDSILVERDAPPIDTGSGPYVDIHAGSMETAVMMRYFPDGIDEAYTRSLEPTKLTMEDLRGIGKSDELTRELIPNGYFGDPAAYDTAAAEATIKADVAAYVETVAGYLGG